MPYLPRSRPNKTNRPQIRVRSIAPFHWSHKWKKTRSRYIVAVGMNIHDFALLYPDILPFTHSDNKTVLICESCVYGGKIVSHASMPVDHIIKIEGVGGAKIDYRNLQLICNTCHSRKSGMESHKPILVDFELNEKGEKIPIKKEDIWKVLNDIPL